MFMFRYLNAGKGQEGLHTRMSEGGQGSLVLYLYHLKFFMRCINALYITWLSKPNLKKEWIFKNNNWKYTLYCPCPNHIHTKLN